MQIQTPLITSSDCEGAGEVFRVEDGPASSPLNPPPLSAPSLTSPASTPPPSTDPKPSPRYLTVSSQLHLEAMVASISKVYTLSPSFRAEKSDTARHLQEFWMLEAEVGFLPLDQTVGLEEVMDVAEGVVRRVASHMLSNNLEDLSFFDSHTPGLISQLERLVASPPFPRITYTEAISILSSHSESNPSAFSFKPSWGNSIATEHEKWLAESYAKGPLFVTDYPASLKPFYMLRGPSSPQQTAACFDLLVPRLGELAGGSLREHRHAQLLEAMELHKIDPAEYSWYLDLRKYGSTRHGGFGMGWERLVAYLTGLENVRDCIAFPRAAEGSRF